MDKLNPALKQGSDPDRDKRNPELETRLKAAFKGCCVGTIHAYAICDSTMERAHALAREGAGEGTLVFAAKQTSGRGRLGRRWESPEGGAYFSLILRPTRPPAEAPQLSLVAGLAAAEAIHEELGRQPGGKAGEADSEGPRQRRGDPKGAAEARPSVAVRWPNDILLGGKKVAGILTEGTSGSSVQRIADSVQNYVVVGVGINISTDPRELPETATSLQEASSSTLNAERYTLEPLVLVSEVCRKFDSWYDIWTAQGFAPIRAALRPWMNLGSLVRLTVGGSQVEGQAIDVDEQGRLLVRLESGVMRAFEAGEVTLLR